MSGFYRLDDEGEPVPVEDVYEWGEWFETSGAERVLIQERPRPNVFVSTVFLALDHGFMFRDGEAPTLWETMIFGGPLDGFQRRYRSRLDALRGHAAAVGLVELYAACPRKLKKALRKYFQYDAAPLRIAERRRVARALAVVSQGREDADGDDGF